MIRNPETQGALKNSKRPPTPSETAERRSVRGLTLGEQSLSELKNGLQLPIATFSIRRVLHDSGYLQYCRMTIAPYLTQRHKSRRVEQSMRNLEYCEQNGRTVIFSDERKLDVDSLDKLGYYWHDLRAEERVFQSAKRVKGL